jgi:hypothetical protein
MAIEGPATTMGKAGPVNEPAAPFSKDLLAIRKVEQDFNTLRDKKTAQNSSWAV